MSPLPDRKLRLARLNETVSSLPPAVQSSGEEFRRIQETVRAAIERPQHRQVPTLRRK
jgi:hypothetical protein